MVELDKVFDKVVKDKIRTIPNKIRTIETAKDKGKLLAVRGQYDYVEKVIPHCYAAEKRLLEPTEPPPDLQHFDVIFIGCPGQVNIKEWGQPLHTFLEQGGVLLTTDWCLQNLVQVIFPNTIHKVGTAEGNFALRVRMPEHPLLEGIPNCAGISWLVETASHKIGIHDPQRVEVILDAPDMGESSNVLVAFPVGKGLVVHAISHFHLQGSDETGEYVSAYILTNIIDEAIRRRYPDVNASRVRVVSSKQSQPLRIRVLKSQ